MRKGKEKNGKKKIGNLKTKAKQNIKIKGKTLDKAVTTRKKLPKSQTLIEKLVKPKQCKNINDELNLLSNVTHYQIRHHLHPLHKNT